MCGHEKTKCASKRLYIGHSSEPERSKSNIDRGVVCEIWGQVLSEICSGNELFTDGPTAQRPNGPTAQRPNGPTAQRRHIIIFSSATLRIEFRLKIF